VNYLTIQEVEKTLEIAYESARNHLMILLSFQHGMRRGEISALRMEDVQGGHIRIARLKGSLTTIQPLVPSHNAYFDEVIALERWLRFRPQETPFLFPSYKKSLTGGQIERIAKQYLLRAGVKKSLAHHHAFKHAFCSIQARRGVKIEYIAQSVGHRDIKNTRIYLNVTDSEAMNKASEAIESALRREK